MQDPTLPRKIVTVIFYRESNGSEPVRKWLKSLSKGNRKIIGEDIKTVELGWPLGMPLVRNIGDGLWEVRSNIPKKIARVIFVMKNGSMVLLHGFIKKSQKTPLDDLKIARRRAHNIKE